MEVVLTEDSWDTSTSRHTAHRLFSTSQSLQNYLYSVNMMRNAGGKVYVCPQEFL